MVFVEYVFGFLDVVSDNVGLEDVDKGDKLLEF